ncbi:MAG: HAD-IIIC family phosphatase, partial [Candidatus Omnitrophica bacterium]|nr:HAD-IIIC family phosphatase [Candidatus Omnitrophota bacterium]
EDLFRKKRQPVLPALEAFKDEPKFRRGQIREFSAKLDECIKRLKMSDEQKNKTPLKIKILAAMEIRTVQDLLKLNYLFKTRQVLINVREGFLSAREIEAGNIRKRIWQGHLPVMREATSQRNKTMRDLAGEIKDGLQTDDTFNASQKRITLQLKGYLKKCDILAWSKAAQEPEYYWVREAAQGIRSALTYYSEAARQRVKGMCVYIMRKAKTADILAKLMERYRSLYVDLRLKKMPHEQARDKAFNDAYQDFATDANISRGSPKDYLYFAFFYMAVYIRTKGKKKPTEKAPITNPVFHAALVLIRIIEAKKLTYLNKLGRNAQEKVDSLNDKENFSKLTTGQMYEVVDAIAVDRELAEAQKQELLRMIRYPGDFSALRDTQPPKAGTSSKSKRRVSPGSSAIVNAAKLVLSCASIFFLQRAFGYFGLTFGVALAMVAPPLFWGSWISDVDREEINDADTLSNYIDALEENVCEGYTVGMETEAYDRKFLRPLFELFFLRLERDFSQAEEFIARCRQVLDRQDAFRLRGMMNDRYRMLTTAFIKVKRDHAAQEASVGFYGLLMFYLTAAPEFYLGHLYGEYMKTKSSIPLSISRKNISYHTRGDSIVYLYDKVMLYEGEHAKYTSSLDFRYGETKPQEPTELQDKENKEKLQEAIRVWGECLLKDTPRETRKSIEERRRRFIDTATVIQLKMRTPLLFSDPEHKVVRILHTGRSRRAQFFSKTYLDNLRIDDGLDMLELAFWLNFGQRFIDSHDRMLAVKKEKKEELHAIQNTVVGVNQSFLRHPEDGFFVKPADFKKRLTELMREDILRIYKDVLAEAVKEEKETDALLFSGVPLDGKNFTQFCQARDAYLHLLYRYEGMGMHLRAENAYQKMKAVITAIQEFDHKILPLEYQRVLVFTALRFGRFGDFITELRALLTGERSRWRRKRYMAEVLTSRLTITQSMGDGKSFEDDVRRTLATQLEAATPQMLDEVLAVEEEVNRLFRNYFSDPIANFSSENISNETPLEDRKGIVALSYLQQNEEKIKSISPKNPTSNSNNPNSSAFPGIVSKKKLAEHSGEPTYKYEIKFDEENKDYVLGEPIIINRGTKLADFAVREACLNELLRRLVFGYEEAAPRMAAAEMERNMRKQGFASSFTLVITGDEELLKSANDNNLSILPSGHNKWCRDENLYIAAVNLAKDVYSKQRNKEYPENTIFIHPAFFALSIQRQYEVLYHEARSHIGKMLRQELDAAEDTISAILTPEQLFELSEAARIRIDIDEAIKKVGSSIDSSNLESGVEIRLFDSRMEKEDTRRYLSAAILALEERRPDTIIRFIREIAGIRQIMAQRGILDNALLGELMVMAMVLPQTEDLLSALQIELACINLFADRKESIRFEESCMTHGTTYATWEVCSVRAMSSTVFSVYSRLFTTPKSLVSFVRFFAQEIKNEPSLLNVLNDKDKLYAYIFNSYKNKVKISQGDSRKKGPVNPDPNLQDRMIKCIVLDCDNTLWAGIIDEVGTREIRVTPPYAQFQRALLAFKEKGIILAINSKNELEDIEEVLEYNQGMVLKKDDFAVIRANWQEKAFNMLEIARELNIGLDSIAFIDDSSKETVLIRMMLPEILVFDFPADIEDIPILLQELSNLTPRGSITSEDSIRTQLYDAKRQRDELRKRLGSLQAYYCSLGMRILIREGMENRPYIARIVQLIGRTNQFNLNDVKRYPGYDERGIEDKMEDDSCRVFTLELEDIFGSGGIVGVIILKKIRVRGDGWQIEVFCLSCRAIGLTVEQAFLAHLIKKLKEEAALTLRGIYRPSGKNKLVSDLYTRLGFLSVSSHLYGSDVKCYDFNLSKGNLEVPPWIIVHKKEDPDLFALADKKPVESGNIPKGNIFQVRVNDIIYLHLRPLAFLAGVIVKKLGEPPLSIEVRFSRTAKTLEDSVPGNSMIQMTKLAFPTGRCAWCRSMNMYLRSSLPKSILEEAEAILKDALHGKGLEKTGFAPRETYFPDQANKQYRERIKRLAEKVSSSGLGALCVLLLASVVALIFTHLVGVWGLGGVCLAVAPFLAFKESDLKPIKQFNAFKVKIKGDFDISFYEARSDFGKPLALVDNGWSFKAVFSSQALEKFRCFISGLNMRFTLRAFSFYIYLRESREWGHVQASESMSKIYPVEVSRAIDKFASEVLGSQIALVKEKKRKAKRKEYIANTVKKTDCSSSGQFEDKELEIIRQALAHPDSEFLVIEEINLEKGSCRIRTMRSGRKQGDTATDADISGNARRHCRYILDAKEYAEAACNGKLEILERLYIILRLPERIMVNNGKNSPDYYALRLPEDGDIVVGDKFTRACYDKGLQAMIISGVTFNSPAKLFSCFAHEAGIRLDAENGLCKEEQHLNGIRRELRVVYRLWMDERVSKDGYRKEMARLTISFLNLEAVLLKQNNRLLRGASLRRTLQLGKQMRGLCKKLEDSDSEERIEAARAILEFCRQQFSDILVLLWFRMGAVKISEHFVNEGDDDVRAEYLSVLGFIHAFHPESESAENDIARIFLNLFEVTPLLRKAALKAISQMKQPYSYFDRLLYYSMKSIFKFSEREERSLALGAIGNSVDLRSFRLAPVVREAFEYMKEIAKEESSGNNEDDGVAEDGARALLSAIMNYRCPLSIKEQCKAITQIEKIFKRKIDVLKRQLEGGAHPCAETYFVETHALFHGTSAYLAEIFDLRKSKDKDYHPWLRLTAAQALREMTRSYLAYINTVSEKMRTPSLSEEYTLLIKEMVLSLCWPVALNKKMLRVELNHAVYKALLEIICEFAQDSGLKRLLLLGTDATSVQAAKNICRLRGPNFMRALIDDFRGSHSTILVILVKALKEWENKHKGLLKRGYFGNLSPERIKEYRKAIAKDPTLIEPLQEFDEMAITITDTEVRHCIWSRKAQAFSGWIVEPSIFPIFDEKNNILTVVYSRGAYREIKMNFSADLLKPVFLIDYHEHMEEVQGFCHVYVYEEIKKTSKLGGVALTLEEIFPPFEDAYYKEHFLEYGGFEIIMLDNFVTQVIRKEMSGEESVSFRCVEEAKALVQRIAEKNGFSWIERSKLKQLAHELTFNMLEFARGGVFGAAAIKRQGKCVIEIVGWDSGCGMRDPQAILEYSLKKGERHGLGFKKFTKLADWLEIEALKQLWEMDEEKKFILRGESRVNDGTRISLGVVQKRKRSSLEFFPFLVPQEFQAQDIERNTAAEDACLAVLLKELEDENPARAPPHIIVTTEAGLLNDDDANIHVASRNRHHAIVFLHPYFFRLYPLLQKIILYHELFSHIEKKLNDPEALRDTYEHFGFIDRSSLFPQNERLRRVLIITHVFGGATGQEVYIKNLASYLVQRGYVVHILYTTPDKQAKDQSLVDGLLHYWPVYQQRKTHHDIFPWVYFFLVLKLHRILSNFKVDFINLHSAFRLPPSIVAWYGRLIKKLPIYMTVHNSRRWGSFSLVNWCSKAVAAMNKLFVHRKTAVSRTAAEALGANTVVVGNPFNLEVFNPYDQTTEEAASKWREGLNLSPKTKIIFYPSRITPAKGQLELIGMAAILKEKRRDFAVVMIGEVSHREYYNQLKSEIDKRGLSGTVFILDRLAQEELAPLYAASYFVAMPTQHPEGLPTVCLEAFAMKKPVVAYDSGGTREVVRILDNGHETGIIKPQGDIAGFTQTMDLLLDDPRWVSLMGRQARKVAEKEFAPEICVDKFVSLFNQGTPSNSIPRLRSGPPSVVGRVSQKIAGILILVSLAFVVSLLMDSIACGLVSCALASVTLIPGTSGEKRSNLEDSDPYTRSVLHDLKNKLFASQLCKLIIDMYKEVAEAQAVLAVVRQHSQIYSNLSKASIDFFEGRCAFQEVIRVFNENYNPFIETIKQLRAYTGNGGSNCEDPLKNHINGLVDHAINNGLLRRYHEVINLRDRSVIKINVGEIILTQIESVKRHPLARKDAAIKVFPGLDSLSLNVSTYRTLAEMVLYDLMLNALKYSTGSEIHIFVSFTIEGDLRVAVRSFGLKELQGKKLGTGVGLESLRMALQAVGGTFQKEVIKEGVFTFTAIFTVPIINVPIELMQRTLLLYLRPIALCGPKACGKRVLAQWIASRQNRRYINRGFLKRVLMVKIMEQKTKGGLDVNKHEAVLNFITVILNNKNIIDYSGEPVKVDGADTSVPDKMTGVAFRDRMKSEIENNEEAMQLMVQIFNYEKVRIAVDEFINRLDREAELSGLYNGIIIITSEPINDLRVLNIMLTASSGVRAYRLGKPESAINRQDVITRRQDLAERFPEIFKIDTSNLDVQEAGRIALDYIMSHQPNGRSVSGALYGCSGNLTSEDRKALDDFVDEHPEDCKLIYDDAAGKYDAVPMRTMIYCLKAVVPGMPEHDYIWDRVNITDKGEILEIYFSSQQLLEAIYDRIDRDYEDLNQDNKLYFWFLGFLCHHAYLECVVGYDHLYAMFIAKQEYDSYLKDIIKEAFETTPEATSEAAPENKPDDKEEIGMYFNAIVEIWDRFFSDCPISSIHLSDASEQDALGGRFGLLRKIADTKAFSVYLASDIQSRRKFAVVKTSLISRDVAARTRLERQAHILKDLGNYSRARKLALGLPEFLGDGYCEKGDGYYWMAMEFINGPTLTEYLKGHNQPAEVFAIIEQVLEFLIVCHANDIVHRDIKPHNILMADNQAKVIDFDSAYVMNRSDLPEFFEGSVRYLCPEATIKGEFPVPYWDLFSVGMMLFEIVTGQVLINTNGNCSDTNFIRNRQIPSMSEITRRLSGPWMNFRMVAQVIDHAITPVSSRQYTSALEMLQDLRAVRDGRAGFPLGPKADMAGRALKPARIQLIAALAIGVLASIVFLSGNTGQVTIMAGAGFLCFPSGISDILRSVWRGIKNICGAQLNAPSQMKDPQEEDSLEEGARKSHMGEDAHAGIRDIEAYLGAVKVTEQGKAEVKLIRDAIGAVKKGRFQSGNIVDLRGIAEGLEIMLVGDLHARRDNLEKILFHKGKSDSGEEEPPVLDKVKNRRGLLIILGDAVHDNLSRKEGELSFEETQLRLADMSSSLAIARDIMELKINHPDYFYYCLGNHDSPEVDCAKWGVKQTQLFVNAMLDTYGWLYFDLYREYVKESPLLLAADGLIATHAGPVKPVLTLEEVRWLEKNDPKLYIALWGRFKHIRDIRFAYFDSDVIDFMDKFGQPQAYFVVGHDQNMIPVGNFWASVSDNPQFKLYIIDASSDEAGYALYRKGKLEFVQCTYPGTARIDDKDLPRLNISVRFKGYKARVERKALFSLPEEMRGRVNNQVDAFENLLNDYLDWLRRLNHAPPSGIMKFSLCPQTTDSQKDIFLPIDYTYLGGVAESNRIEIAYAALSKPKIIGLDVLGHEIDELSAKSRLCPNPHQFACSRSLERFDNDPQELRAFINAANGSGARLNFDYERDILRVALRHNCLVAVFARASAIIAKQSIDFSAQRELTNLFMENGICFQDLRGSSIPLGKALEVILSSEKLTDKIEQIHIDQSYHFVIFTFKGDVKIIIEQTQEGCNWHARFVSVDEEIDATNLKPRKFLNNFLEGLSDQDHVGAVTDAPEDIARFVEGQVPEYDRKPVKEFLGQGKTIIQASDGARFLFSISNPQIEYEKVNYNSSYYDIAVQEMAGDRPVLPVGYCIFQFSCQAAVCSIDPFYRNSVNAIFVHEPYDSRYKGIASACVQLALYYTTFRGAKSFHVINIASSNYLSRLKFDADNAFHFYRSPRPFIDCGMPCIEIIEVRPEAVLSVDSPSNTMRRLTDEEVCIFADTTRLLGQNLDFNDRKWAELKRFFACYLRFKDRFRNATGAYLDNCFSAKRIADVFYLWQVCGFNIFELIEDGKYRTVWARGGARFIFRRDLDNNIYLYDASDRKSEAKEIGFAGVIDREVRYSFKDSACFHAYKGMNLGNFMIQVYHLLLWANKGQKKQDVLIAITMDTDRLCQYYREIGAQVYRDFDGDLRAQMPLYGGIDAAILSREEKDLVVAQRPGQWRCLSQREMDRLILDKEVTPSKSKLRMSPKIVGAVILVLFALAALAMHPVTAGVALAAAAVVPLRLESGENDSDPDFAEKLFLSFNRQLNFKDKKPEQVQRNINILNTCAGLRLIAMLPKKYKLPQESKRLIGFLKKAAWALKYKGERQAEVRLACENFFRELCAHKKLIEKEGDPLLYIVGDEVTDYMETISDYPLLTRVGEIAMAVLARLGDEEAQEKLITSNLRLVVAISYDYHLRRSFSRLDLIAAGNLALTKNAMEWDPCRCTKFSTFISKGINWEMRIAFANNQGDVCVPIDAQIKHGRIAKELSWPANGGNNSNELDDKERYKHKISRPRYISFQDPIAKDDTKGQGKRKEGILEIPDEGCVVQPCLNEDLQTAIGRGERRLREIWQNEFDRNWRIFELRTLLPSLGRIEAMSLRELAQYIGGPRYETIRRTDNKAKEVIREEMDGPVQVPGNGQGDTLPIGSKNVSRLGLKTSLVLAGAIALGCLAMHPVAFTGVLCACSPVVFLGRESAYSVLHQATTILGKPEMYIPKGQAKPALTEINQSLGKKKIFTKEVIAAVFSGLLLLVAGLIGPDAQAAEILSQRLLDLRIDLSSIGSVFGFLPLRPGATGGVQLICLIFALACFVFAAIRVEKTLIATKSTRKQKIRKAIARLLLAVNEVEKIIAANKELLSAVENQLPSPVIDKYVTGNSKEPLMGSVSLASINSLIKRAKIQLEDLQKRVVGTKILTFDKDGNPREMGITEEQVYELLRITRSGAGSLWQRLRPHFVRSALPYRGIELEAYKLYRALALAQTLAYEAKRESVIEKTKGPRDRRFYGEIIRDIKKKYRIALSRMIRYDKIISLRHSSSYKTPVFLLWLATSFLFFAPFILIFIAVPFSLAYLDVYHGAGGMLGTFCYKFIHLYSQLHWVSYAYFGALLAISMVNWVYKDFIVSLYGLLFGRKIIRLGKEKIVARKGMINPIAEEMRDFLLRDVSPEAVDGFINTHQAKIQELTKVTGGSLEAVTPARLVDMLLSKENIWKNSGPSRAPPRILIEEFLNLSAINERFPVYTVLLPAFGEPRVIAKLIDSIDALVYPKNKLDIILLPEVSDFFPRKGENTSTLAAMQDKLLEDPLRYAHFRMLISGIRISDEHSQTKAHATNFALGISKGKY